MTPSTGATAIRPAHSTGPTDMAGPAGIEVAPGVRDAPGIAAALQTLGRYFEAINQRDRVGWTDSLVPGPGRATDSQWAGLQTTQDSDMVITGVDLLSEGELQVSVRYVSRQAPAAGYGHGCLRWQEAFVLAPYEGQLRISTVDDSALSRQPC